MTFTVHICRGRYGSLEEWLCFFSLYAYARLTLGFLRSITKRQWVNDLRRILCIYKELRPLRRQLQSSEGRCFLFMPQDGIDNVCLQIPLIAASVRLGYVPTVLLASRANVLQRLTYNVIGVSSFRYLDDYRSPHDYRKLIRFFESCRSQSDLIELKYKQVKLGKYVTSSLMRLTRRGTLEIKDANTRTSIEKLLIKGASSIEAASKLLDCCDPAHVQFMDRGYLGEGPFFDLCINRGIGALTLNVGHRDSSLVIKRYTKENAGVHHLSLGSDLWSELTNAEDRNLLIEQAKREIRTCYASRQWYGEVGTTDLLDQEASASEIEALGISDGKPVCLVCPHIFWDATFFWGTDLYEDYEQWFGRVLDLASEIKDVHWIIKVHPANRIKNMRDGVNSEYSEVAVLQQFNPMPSNIYVLYPETSISFLDVLKLSKFVLTVRGTVGIEGGLFGCKVITAGTGRFDGHGFSVDPVSIKEYEELIRNIGTLETADQKAQEMAGLYAYGTYIRKTLNTESISFSFKDGVDGSLTAEISKSAKTDIFLCGEVLSMCHGLQSEVEDIVTLEDPH